MSEIVTFNRTHQPFYLVSHRDDLYSLCYVLGNPENPYESRWQEQFSQYACRHGKEPMEQGVFTHGSGYDWEEVFRYAFRDRPELSQIRFDCEAGGFFCYCDKLEPLMQLGAEFRALCIDEERMEQLIESSLTARENREMDSPEQKTGEIVPISLEELGRMQGQEGLVLQGCGGALSEWLEGINELLTEEGILQNGSTFQRIYTFTHENLTNLLFPFQEDLEMDVGRLASWRLRTHETFGGCWLSDYLPNHLGIGEDSPECELEM